MSHVSSIPSLPNQELHDSDPARKKLKETCREFEAVMVSLVLKEGLNGAQEMGQTPGVDEDEDSGTKTFKQFAYEQMSYCIGKTGLLGLGDRLYDAMKDKVLAKADEGSQDSLASLKQMSTGRRIK